MIETTVPVVVISRGGNGDVGVARTLGRLGVPVYLVAQEGSVSAAWWSRYWAGKDRWDFDRPEEESIRFLLGLADRLDPRHPARPILLTLADWGAVFIETHRSELGRRFVFPQPAGPNVIRTLLNKWEMHLLALRTSIPTPTTALPRSLREADEFLDAVGLPVVLKAADPYAPHPPKTRVVNTRPELVDELVRREAAGRPLNAVLQEFIPGGVDSVWMCNGCFSDDPADALTLTGQKLRQTHAAGVASLAVCTPNDMVARQTRQLMEGVGYRGCVGVGWRYDQRDGQYKLLDVNARVSGVFRLFAGTNDIDVVRACYLGLTGQDVPTSALRPGRKWMLEDDLVSAARALRSDHLTVREWLRSLRGVRELNWLAADDPGPALRWIGGRLGAVLR